jgi:LysM repeat protein
VQANPRNAAAHFELGVLYEQNVHDFISALYHFQKHLELRPKSEYKDAIEPRMKTCKLELAKSVTFGVVTADVHRDLVKLTNEIGVLRQQSDALRAQLAAKPTMVTQWMTLRVTNFMNVTQRVMVAAAPTPVTPAVIATNSAPVRPLIAPAPRTNATVRPAQPAQVSSPLTQTTVTPPARAQRTHKVQSGENMSEIARRYGISAAKLQEANRSVDPRRMRAGQTLIIP